MSAAATVVTFTVSDDDAEELRKHVEAFLIPAARETIGYQGYVLFDQDEGRRLVIVLYDSLENAKAAQNVTVPVAEDHVIALMSSPPVRTLGIVSVSDGVFAGSDES